MDYPLAEGITIRADGTILAKEEAKAEDASQIAKRKRSMGQDVNDSAPLITIGEDSPHQQSKRAATDTTHRVVELSSDDDGDYDAHEKSFKMDHVMRDAHGKEVIWIDDD